MAWRESLIETIGPGVFSGITLGRWLGVLRENRFAIDLPHWPRAAAVTLCSIPNTLVGWWEDRLYGRAVRAATVHPPLFVLGIWRSGTTLLHNLLAQDDRFAYPNNYQVCYPCTFLCTERTSAGLVGWFMPRTRPQDNVLFGIGEPQEDEFAFASLSGRTFAIGWSFPRRVRHYERYLTFRDAAQHEVDEWKAGLSLLVRKLSYKYQKPLILKSPGHTCRIRLLLELFPDARFVHIHRNPVAVYQSTQRMLRKISPWVTFQRTPWAELESRIIPNYREVYEAFFEERALIPAGRLHEVGFEALEADPIGQVRAIYEGLSLPDFAHVEPALRRYVSSLQGYRKNEFPTLAPEIQARVATELRPCFEEWGYAASVG